MLSYFVRKWRGYRLLYGICNGPWDFIRCCFLNRWINPFRYRLCTACLLVSVRKPFLVGVYSRLLHLDWLCPYCEKACSYLKHCHTGDCVMCRLWARGIAERREEAQRFWQRP